MITLKGVTLRRSAKVLLDNASVTLNPGEKVGLVGRNGAGKSTLFALLAGELHEDGGDCTMPPHWRIAQVAQQMPETDQSATAFVLAGDMRLVHLHAVLADAEARGDGIGIAQAHADQKIVQSRRAVEIETLNAQAEVEPLLALASQISSLQTSGDAVLPAYLRNVKLSLFRKAGQVILEDPR